MIMLEFDPELNKNENFSLKGHNYEFFIDSAVLSSFCKNDVYEFSSCIFFCRQACEYVAN
jgi:hypothetical protein